MMNYETKVCSLGDEVCLYCALCSTSNIICLLFLCINISRIYFRYITLFKSILNSAHYSQKNGSNSINHIFRPPIGNLALFNSKKKAN